MAIGQHSVFVSQLVEVGVEQGTQRLGPSVWVVVQKTGHEVNRFSWRSVAEHLIPGQWLNLGEAVLGVVRVHGQNLFAGRCAQDFDNFNQLVNSAFSREDWLPEHKFGDDAPYRPHINVGAVVRVAKDQFRRPVVPRTDVTHIGFALNQLFGRPKVAEFEDVGTSVTKNILGFYVSVADSFGVDVGNGAQ